MSDDKNKKEIRGKHTEQVIKNQEKEGASSMASIKAKGKIKNAGMIGAGKKPKVTKDKNGKINWEKFAQDNKKVKNTGAKFKFDKDNTLSKFGSSKSTASMQKVQKPLKPTKSNATTKLTNNSAFSKVKTNITSKATGKMQKTVKADKVAVNIKGVSKFKAETPKLKPIKAQEKTTSAKATNPVKNNTTPVKAALKATTRLTPAKSAAFQKTVKTVKDKPAKQVSKKMSNVMKKPDLPKKAPSKGRGK